MVNARFKYHKRKNDAGNKNNQNKKSKFYQVQKTFYGTLTQLNLVNMSCSQSSL